MSKVSLPIKKEFIQMGDLRFTRIGDFPCSFAFLLKTFGYGIDISNV